MLNIDRYAYSSALKKQDPREKLVFALTTLGVCLWADSIIVASCICLIMTLITVLKGKIPLKFFLKLMFIPLAFLSIGVLTIAFDISSQKEQFIFAAEIFNRYMGVSKAGLLKATVIFFKALGGTACLYYLSLNTPMVDLLLALKKFRFPQLILELMGLIYRFIFVFMETASVMFTAQESRLGYTKLSLAYRSMGMLVSTLFIRAYKKSDELYTALESRGYEGDLQVLHEPFTSSLSNYFMIAGINSILVLIALGLKHYTGGLR